MAEAFLKNSGYESHMLLEYIRLYQYCCESGNYDVIDVQPYAGRIAADLGRYLAKPHLNWLDDAFFMLAEVYLSGNIKFSFEDEAAKQMDETATVKNVLLAGIGGGATGLWQSFAF